MTKIFTIILALFASCALAVTEVEGDSHAVAHDHLPPESEKLTQVEDVVSSDVISSVVESMFGWLPFPVTNSMLMTILAGALLIVLFRIAAGKMSVVPSGAQNFAEFAVSSMYNFLESLMGAHLVKRTFWFLGSTFFLILFSNWMGLIPGVGTVGLQAYDVSGNIVDFPNSDHDHFRPFLRGANADQNVTFVMSVTFTVLWLYWSITEIGVGGVFKHMFAPKGKFGVGMMMIMVPIFFLVGVIEIVSIFLVRPLTLGVRLYGNIFAGETLLENMFLTSDSMIGKILIPLPFYFMELLVGFIQAFVFTVLCAIFIKLMCEHHDEDHEEAHH